MTWFDIKGYEGLYQVNKEGQIKSVKRTRLNKLTGNYNEIPERILRPNTVGFGYQQITLCKEGKRAYRYVHVIVAETFLGNKPKGYEVNHIDEDKTNNALSNLEYETPKYNNNYGSRIAKVREKLTNGKKSKPVVGTSIYDGHIVEFPSISEARRQGYGNHISDVVLGKRSQCKGYVWKFKALPSK